MKPRFEIPTGCIAAILICTLATAPASELFAEPRDLSRYESIWTRSPFVAVTDLSGQADDLAGRFVLTGFARMGDKDVIFLFDRTSLERFSLTPGQARQGLSLQSLTHEGDLKSVRASVVSGGKTLVLAYDPQQQPDGAQPMAAAMPFAQGQPVQPAQAVRHYPGQPGFDPSQPAHGMSNTQPSVQQNGVIVGQGTQQPMPENVPSFGGDPALQNGETAPPPRRVIRRRAIVAPE